MSKESLTNIESYMPNSEDFIFRNYPIYWLTRLTNSYTQVMEVRLKELKLNITYWRVGLILQSYGKISMTEISKHAVGRLPTITKAVYRMQEFGWVEITQQEEDKRITMVNITPDGDQVLNAAVERTSKIISRAFDGFTREELDTLNKLTKKMSDNLS